MKEKIIWQFPVMELHVYGKVAVELCDKILITKKPVISEMTGF
jgi:hypothetical protein